MLYNPTSPPWPDSHPSEQAASRVAASEDTPRDRVARHRYPSGMAGVPNHGIRTTRQSASNRFTSRAVIKGIETLGPAVPWELTRSGVIPVASSIDLWAANSAEIISGDFGPRSPCDGSNPRRIQTEFLPTFEQRGVDVLDGGEDAVGQEVRPDSVRGCREASEAR